MLKQSIKQYRNIKRKYYIFATANLCEIPLVKKECKLLGLSYRMIDGQLFIEKINE